MDNPFTGLGRALRWLRLQRAMKQYELSDAAGITKGMVSVYELGKQMPNVETLGRILAALDADLKTLHEALEVVRREPPRPSDQDDAEPAADLLEMLGFSDLTPQQETRARDFLRRFSTLIKDFLEEKDAEG